MSLNSKSKSHHSSSSSKSGKFLNPMEIENFVFNHIRSRDLFDQLLDENTTISEEERYSVSHTIQALNLSPRQHPGCKCSKIDCLKLYCECFSKGRICTSSCHCVNCNNNDHNHQEIYRAKQIANFRHPGFFQGVPSFVPTRKCTCKKSLCQKKYCECFSAGLKCTQECQCINCHNQRPHSHGSNQSMGSLIQVNA